MVQFSMIWGYPRGLLETSIPIIGLSENMQEAMVFTMFDMINMGLSSFNVPKKETVDWVNHPFQ